VNTGDGNKQYQIPDELITWTTVKLPPTNKFIFISNYVYLFISFSHNNNYMGYSAYTNFSNGVDLNAVSASTICEVGAFCLY
jgi:hypothetical protein